MTHIHIKVYSEDFSYHFVPFELNKEYYKDFKRDLKEEIDDILFDVLFEKYNLIGEYTLEEVIKHHIEQTTFQ